MMHWGGGTLGEEVATKRLIFQDLGVIASSEAEGSVFWAILING